MRTQHRNTPPIPRYTPLFAALIAAFPACDAMATMTRPVNCTGTSSITCVISSTADDAVDPGPTGSLREAISYLNTYHLDALGNPVPNCTGTDKITFSGPVPFVITVANSLPSIDCGGLTIDGQLGRSDRAVITIPNGLWSRTGIDVFFGPANGQKVRVKNLEVSGFVYGTGILGNVDVSNSLIHGMTGNTGIGVDLHYGASISGSQVFSNCTGIYTEYGGNDIGGNSIYANTCKGIDIRNVSVGPHIHGNNIGLDSAGNPAGNSNQGVYINNSTAELDHNYISANGIGIYLDATGGVSIHHNNIGTNIAGDVAMGNQFGIFIGGFSYGSDIFNNTISGNTALGIDVSDADSLSIHKNNVGTTASGLASLGNSRGMSVNCTNSFDITDNTISGNNNNGLELGAISSGGTLQVTGNRIGVDGNGILALGNNAYGILLGLGGCPTRSPALASPRFAARSSAGITFSGNTIANNTQAGLGIFDGSNNVITGNTIRNNAKEGVYINLGTGNSIVQNFIYDNGLKNINLGYPGSFLPNDYGVGDADTGPNNRQNFPDVGPVIRGASTTTVNFTLDSALGTYRVDLYSNSASVPGGKVWHGSTNLTLAVTGAASGSFAIASTEVDNISLTATSTTNDTSEFSPVGFVQTTPDVAITPTGHDFGNVATGGSAAFPISITSTGTAPYVINSLSGDGACYGGPICYGGAFLCSTNCVTGDPGMAKKASCQITATFAPTTLGPKSTTITVCDRTTTRLRDIVLTGNGVVPPPVSIDPLSFDFGETLVGHRSPAKTFRITNPGTVAVPIGRVAATGDFLLDSTTCASSIPPAGGCDANVVFAPLLRGPADGTLDVQAGALVGSAPSTQVLSELPPPSGATARLTGLGTTEADAGLPASLDLGTQTRGQPALSRAFNLSSNGNQSLEVAQVSTSAPFAATHNCPALLPPGNQCTITVTYTSNALGTFTGRLDVVTNSASGSGAVQLIGRTVEVASPLLRLSANSIGFGGRLLGTQSPAQRVTVENVGNIAATFASIVTSNLDFLVSGTTCTGALLPTLSCFVDVVMRPVGFGPRSGQLLVNSNATGTPHTVTLAGSGCRPFTGAGARNGSRDNCAP